MKAAALLIVLLSNDGYWLGGRLAEVRFEPTALARAGRVHWVLAYDDIRIASGSVDVVPGRTTAVKLSLPPVTQRTPLRFVYRLRDAAGKQLEAGDAAVHVFPDNLLADAGVVLGRSRLIVWGHETDPLPTLLTRTSVPHLTVEGYATLRLLRPDVVLIGPRSLDETRAEFRPSLDALARSGATIVVFRQERVDRLGGYPLIARTVPATLGWQSDHPLLAPFSIEDLASLAPSASKQLALQLPSDEAPRALAVWPAESNARQAGPLDALLVFRTVGLGRVILCQLPFGDDWVNDLRMQLFLRSALEFAVTPVGAATPRGKPASGSMNPERISRGNLITTRGKP